MANTTCGNHLLAQATTYQLNEKKTDMFHRILTPLGGINELIKTRWRFT